MENNKHKTIKSVSSRSGFTLLEVITAIFILTVGIGGSLTLVHQTISGVSNLESRLIASYLGQEGLEIVRNLRDRAWLEQATWDINIPSGNCFEADYDDETLTACVGDPRLLKIENGLYGYYGSGIGEKTKFTRTIQITDVTSDIKEVLVRVEWEERGESYSFETAEYLTNWFEGWGD